MDSLNGLSAFICICVGIYIYNRVITVKGIFNVGKDA